tara:strand:+ start:1655 stop:2365 length:711 start_codon:yes stop_codon:yes gene_type:complete
MPLPKLNVPEYNLKLPSSGKSVKYRPFLVKEEKLLYLAIESGEQKDMIDAVKNILTSCTSLRSVKDLATFDIEYLFLKIRTRSVGENVEVNITCPDDNETTVPVSIPLDDIDIKQDPAHSAEIQLNDDVIITMGYPSFDTFVKMNLQGEEPGMDQVFEMAAACVKTIADANQVYDCKESSKKELLSFFDEMNSAQFAKIQTFFETMPKLSHTIKVTNPNTGVDGEVKLEGLASFFE